MMRRLLFVVFTLVSSGTFAASTATCTPTTLPTAVPTASVNDLANHEAADRSLLAQLNTMTRSIIASLNSIKPTSSYERPSAWINATCSGDTPTAYGKFNTASIAQIGIGAGQFNWTFTDALSNTFYSVVITADNATGTVNAQAVNVLTRATTGITFEFLKVGALDAGAWTKAAPAGFSAMVFGGK